MGEIAGPMPRRKTVAVKVGERVEVAVALAVAVAVGSDVSVAVTVAVGNSTVIAEPCAVANTFPAVSTTRALSSTAPEVGG